jgi:hypothetical protein
MNSHSNNTKNNFSGNMGNMPNYHSDFKNYNAYLKTIKPSDPNNHPYYPHLSSFSLPPAIGMQSVQGFPRHLANQHHFFSSIPYTNNLYNPQINVSNFKIENFTNSNSSQFKPKRRRIGKKPKKNEKEVLTHKRKKGAKGTKISKTSKSNKLNPKNKINSKKLQNSIRSSNFGLKEISKHVKEIVRRLRKTTYKQISDIIVNEINEKDSKDEKNIRRRIYDSLNVMKAMNLFEKDPSNKFILWNGDRADYNNYNNNDNENESMSESNNMSQSNFSFKKEKTKINNHHSEYINENNLNVEELNRLIVLYFLK